MTQDRPEQDRPGSGSASDEPVPAPVVNSRDLFRGQQEVRISHDGEIYRLRVTRNGKLILNK